MLRPARVPWNLTKFHGGDRIADPGTGARTSYCLTTDPKTVHKLANASSRVIAAIAKKCGGSDAVCGTPDPGEETVTALGFETMCPAFAGGAGSGCAATVADCGDLATCVRCTAEEAVDTTMARSYDMMADADPGPEAPLNTCQRTLGRETAKYLLTREKLLWKCNDARLKGKHSDVCPDITAPVGRPAWKTAAKIAKAESKRIRNICKKCGGPSKSCDATVTMLNPGGPTAIPGVPNGDDFSPAAIGAPADCATVTAPPNPSRPATPCGGPVATLADLITCVGCVTEFNVDCVAANAHPRFVAYPCECR